MGMSFLTKAFFAVLAFLAANAVAGEASKKLTVDEVLSRVDEAQTRVADAQMDLEMEMKDTLSGSGRKMRGLLQLRDPDLVRVHYKSPEEQFLYIGGKKAQMYDPGQKMVYLQQGSAPVYVGVGKQLKQYVKSCKVTLVPGAGDEVGLLFIPKDNIAAGFDRMKVLVRRKDWWPQRLEMETPSLKTRARFSNFKFDQGLPESLFKFTPPKGAEVVDGAIF
jgi:outer membrane lipoprotein-sorting protein